MADPQESPRWWLAKLEGELVGRQAEMKLMNDYYEGNHPLPFVTKAHSAKMRDEFHTLLEDSRSNFMRLVVDVVEERLKVEGFRLSASQDEKADQGAWDIWQANQMDAESPTAFIEALVKGRAYLSVWAGDPHPVIAVEDPMQTIVGYVPGSNYRQRAAALKVWTDDWTGDRKANVYLPGGIYKFTQSESSQLAPPAIMTAPEQAYYASTEGSSWKELDREFQANELGIVPIIPLRNRPRLLREGESELADVYRVQNQINGFLFLLALAGYFGAHKQRWAVGLAIMEDPITHKPVEPFDVAIDKLWHTDNPNVTFGEFSQTDLAGYIQSIDQKLQHIAITTRTPKHYLLPEGQEPSGDALKSAESGLVKKVERKQRPFGEGLEEALRLARRFAGEKDAPVDSEIVWADAEQRSEAAVTDAAIKRFQAGLTSWEQTMEDIGYSQTAIARMASQRLQDALLNALSQPAAPEPVPALAVNGGGA